MWITSHGLGSSYFARHYFRNRVFFLFLWVLRCFSSPRSLPIHYFTHVWITSLFPLVEFPHSDICESMDICSSSQLFAACHVLHRLLVPRHSPYALSSLTFLHRFFVNPKTFFVTRFSSLPYFIYIFFNVLKINLNNLFRFIDGGAKESRTPDLLLARQALYQLSYVPIMCHLHESVVRMHSLSVVLSQ